MADLKIELLPSFKSLKQHHLQAGNPYFTYFKAAIVCLYCNLGNGKPSKMKLTDTFVDFTERNLIFSLA